LLDAPQLGVAGRSPVTAIEDQQHAFRRSCRGSGPSVDRR
jgi:hypothetical protein